MRPMTMRIVDHSSSGMLAWTVIKSEGFSRASHLPSDVGDVRVVLISSRDCVDLGSILRTCGAQRFIPEVELSGAAVLGALVR